MIIHKLCALGHDQIDAKGNTLAKAVFEKTAKKDHIKATVEGVKRGGKILV